MTVDTGSTVNVFVLLTDEARTRFSRIQSRLIIISKGKKYHIFKSSFHILRGDDTQPQPRMPRPPLTYKLPDQDDRESDARKADVRGGGGQQTGERMLKTKA